MKIDKTKLAVELEKQMDNTPINEVASELPETAPRYHLTINFSYSIAKQCSSSAILSIVTSTPTKMVVRVFPLSSCTTLLPQALSFRCCELKCAISLLHETLTC